MRTPLPPSDGRSTIDLQASQLQISVSGLTRKVVSVAGVLDNWLTYFIKDDGFVLYRGLEMAQHGRMLTNIAQYYKYTGDTEPLLKHLDKIAGTIALARLSLVFAILFYIPFCTPLSLYFTPRSHNLPSIQAWY